jgi:hypothetical protein
LMPVRELPIAAGLRLAPAKQDLGPATRAVEMPATAAPTTPRPKSAWTAQAMPGLAERVLVVALAAAVPQVARAVPGAAERVLAVLLAVAAPEAVWAVPGLVARVLAVLRLERAPRPGPAERLGLPLLVGPPLPGARLPLVG